MSIPIWELMMYQWLIAILSAIAFIGWFMYLRRRVPISPRKQKTPPLNNKHSHTKVINDPNDHHD